MTEWGQIVLSDALVMVRLLVVLLLLAWLFDRWSRGVRRWALTGWMVLCLTAMAALDVYFAEAGCHWGRICSPTPGLSWQPRCRVQD